MGGVLFFNKEGKKQTWQSSGSVPASCISEPSLTPRNERVQIYFANEALNGHTLAREKRGRQQGRYENEM
jgi:hypothetical protein